MGDLLLALLVPAIGLYAVTVWHAGARPPADSVARHLLVQHQDAVAMVLAAPASTGQINPPLRWWQQPSAFVSCADNGVVVTSAPPDVWPTPAVLAAALSAQVYHAPGYGLVRAGAVSFSGVLPAVALPASCPLPEGTAAAVTRTR